MADSLIFQTEKNIKEFGEKLTEEDKISIQSNLDELKKAHYDKDVVKIDEDVKKLNDTWATISTRMYQDSSNEQNNPTSDKTEDVNFEEVK